MLQAYGNWLCAPRERGLQNAAKEDRRGLSYETALSQMPSPKREVANRTFSVRQGRSPVQMMKRLSLLLAVMFVASMMFVAPVFAMGNNDNNDNGDHNNGNASIVHRNDNGGDHNNNGNGENKDHAKKHGEDRDHN